MGTWTEAVKREAHRLGFDLVGIAAADAVLEHGAVFLDWLARGYAADMAWLSRDPQRRPDPRRLLVDARAVIVVARNY